MSEFDFNNPQNKQRQIANNILNSYSDLSKAESIDLEKGGKKAFIGEKRMFGGKEYIRTKDGWKYHGKGTGVKAQEHAADAQSREDKKTQNYLEAKKQLEKEGVLGKEKSEFQAVSKLREELKGGRGSGALNNLRLAYALQGWREPLFKDRVAGGFRLNMQPSNEAEIKRNQDWVDFFNSHGIPAKLNNRKDVVIGESSDKEALKWKIARHSK